ncbi:unnamed protein product [Closterium sp. NIES-54]
MRYKIFLPTNELSKTAVVWFPTGAATALAAAATAPAAAAPALSTAATALLVQLQPLLLPLQPLLLPLQPLLLPLRPLLLQPQPCWCSYSPCCCCRYSPCCCRYSPCCCRPSHFYCTYSPAAAATALAAVATAPAAATTAPAAAAPAPSAAAPAPSTADTALAAAATALAAATAALAAAATALAAAATALSAAATALAAAATALAAAATALAAAATALAASCLCCWECWECCWCWGAEGATGSAGGAAGAGGAGPTTDRHCLSWPLSRQLQQLGVDSGGHCLSRRTPPLSSFESGFFSEPIQVVEALVFYVLSVEAAALGASESAAALGASESTATLGARASPATGPSSAEASHTFTLESSASRCFFLVARASTVLPCPAVPSGSLSGLHLPTFSTNLVSNAVIQDVSVDTFITGGQCVAICTSLPSLPHSPAPPCLPCVEGRQRAAPHSSEFPPTTAPLQTLHMDVWGPAPVGGTDQERYFLLVVDDYTRYTTVIPLRRKADVSGVLIALIRATRRQLRERFSQEFPVLRLHSDRGGEFSSDLLAEFCRDEGIVQSFTLPASPQQNGIAERRLGLIMEVGRTSMVHPAAPHFLWPFAVRYAAHQLNLWPRVSEPETSPTLWWTGKVDDVSVFPDLGALSLVSDAKANKLSSRTLCCGPTPSGVSQVDLTPLVEPLEVSSESFGPAEGGDPAADNTTATRRSPRLETPPGFPPRLSSPPPQPAAVESGAETANAESGGAAPEGEGSGGAGSGGSTTGGAGSWGAAIGGAKSGGPASPSGGGAVGDPAGGSRGGGGYGPAGARAASPGGTAGSGGTTGAGGAASAGGTRGAAGAGGAGATSPRGATGAAGAGPTSPRGTASAGGARGIAGARGAGDGGTGGARGAGPGGARTGGAGAAGAGGAVRARAARAGGTAGAGGATGVAGTGGAGGTTGARGPPELSTVTLTLSLLQRLPWTTLAALGFAPSSADPSLFLRTETTLPPFYVLMLVDDLVFATADTEVLALVKAELQERHTCTDLSDLRNYLDLQITRDRARRTITLTQSHMVHQVLQRFAFQFSPQPTLLPTGHSLSAPPSDKSVVPSGPYPELVGCVMYLMTCTRHDLAYPLSLLARYVAPGRHRKVHWDVAKRVLRYLCSTSGMGLVLGGQGSVVLNGHSDASWADDQATQRLPQGYTFSLGSGSVSWRSTRSFCVLSSSCEAEIYAEAMAAQELRWLTFADRLGGATLFSSSSVCRQQDNACLVSRAEIGE